MKTTLPALGLLGMATLAACGNGTMMTTGDVKQTPPTTGSTDVEAWIGLGYYKMWHCESAMHAGRPPSPHGSNRICNNDVLHGKSGNGEYPVGSASVKELGDGMGNINGYAVYRHTAAGTTGDSWYWYERVPLSSPFPKDAKGIVADGQGTSGPPKTICVGCHSAAGSDAMHGGHDFVYTQVP